MRPAGSLIILGFSLMSCVSGPPSHADEVYAAVLAQVHTLENLTQPVLVHPDMLSHHTGPADPWDQVEFYSEHPTDAIGRAARDLGFSVCQGPPELRCYREAGSYTIVTFSVIEWIHENQARVNVTIIGIRPEHYWANSFSADVVHSEGWRVEGFTHTGSEN